MTGTSRISLLPGGLRALLKRREELLVADERAAVQAALDQADPELRAELKQMLGRATTGSGPGSGQTTG